MKKFILILIIISIILYLFLIVKHYMQNKKLILKCDYVESGDIFGEMGFSSLDEKSDSLIIIVDKKHKKIYNVHNKEIKDFKNVEVTKENITFQEEWEKDDSKNSVYYNIDRVTSDFQAVGSYERKNYKHFYEYKGTCSRYKIQKKF